jgi:hypothetical protein
VDYFDKRRPRLRPDRIIEKRAKWQDYLDPEEDPGLSELRGIDGIDGIGGPDDVDDLDDSIVEREHEDEAIGEEHEKPAADEMPRRKDPERRGKSGKR